MLAAEIALLLITISGCLAATVSGPAAVFCWIGVGCQGAAALTNFLALLDTCYAPPHVGLSGAVQDVINGLAIVGAAVSGGIVWRKDLLKLLKRVLRFVG